MAKKTIEKRTFSAPVEFREPPENAGMGVIVGHAALFDVRTEIDDWGYAYTEVIAPGAFTDSIKTDDVRALYNHDINIILGRTSSGTLRLSEDEKGLRYEIDLSSATWAQDVRIAMERGDITQSSFAFIPIVEEYDEEQNLRTIKKVTLRDVSPVVYPAYEGADAMMRSLEQRKLRLDRSRMMTKVRMMRARRRRHG